MSPTISKALSVTAVLVILLCIKLCMNHREAMIAWLDHLDASRALKKRVRGRFLDCSSISKKADPISFVGSRQVSRESHKVAMESAREAVKSSSYFRRLKEEDSMADEGEGGKGVPGK